MENPGDDIILPEVDTEPHPDPVPTKASKKSHLFVILAIAIFLALAGTLVFIIINNNKTTQPISGEPIVSEPIRYNNEQFNEKMDEAESLLSEGDYLSVRSILEENSLTERMTATQKYRFYLISAALYDESALNDATRHAQYEALAAEALAEIRKGEHL